MEKLTLLIMIKEDEKGLLSIAENRSKSMVPLLGDARVLDFFLYPVRMSNYFSAYVNLKVESIEIKDYVNHHYRDYPVKLLVGNNLYENILKVIKREKSPILIIRADGFFRCNWELLFDELLNFKGENRIVLFTGDHGTFESLYIDEKESFYDLVKSITNSNDYDVQNYDESWENLIALSSEIYDRENLKSVEDYYGLKTVREFYDFHMGLLDDMEKCFSYTSLFYNETLGDKDDITIAPDGLVKNSYISVASYIEGTVENSFIFSNVKISKEAYIYKSIIMNNNSIAENSRLEKIILCDSGELLQNVLPRVNENSTLGGRANDGYNKDYPDYINGGISLIGSNVDIPRGFSMEENCYVPSNTGRLILKGKKKLSKGESLIKYSGKNRIQ